MSLRLLHFRLSAASAVVSAPLSPDGTAKVFRRAKRFAPSVRVGSRWLPLLGVLAWWYDGMRAPARDCVVALACIVGAVHRPAGDCEASCRGGDDRSDLDVGRDLAQQLGQHWRVTDAAPGDFDGPDFQRLFVDAKVDLAQHSSLDGKTPDQAYFNPLTSQAAAA